MSPIPRNWLDLAALLDPVGHCADPVAEGSGLDWYGIYALAASQLVAPNLYAELIKSDRLRLAPTEVQDALREFHRLNDERNARHRKILRDTVHILNEHGIEPLVMKGAITLLPGVRPTETTRMMSDIDIALPGVAPERGESALLAAGYYHADGQGPPNFSRCHHLAPLFHPKGEGYVEIHRTILKPVVPPGAQSLAEVSAAAHRIQWDDLVLRIPSIEHRLLHNLLHHQVQDAAKHRDNCSLRQLAEFAQLRGSPDAIHIDWRAEADRLDHFGLGDDLRMYLLLALHLFGQPLPAGLEIGRAATRAERSMWFWQAHPRLFRRHLSAKSLPVRLKRLPRKLVTPGWYPEKYRRLRRDRTRRV